MSTVTCPRFLRVIYSPPLATKTADSPQVSVKSHSLPETLGKMAPLSTSLTSSRKSYWIWVLSLALKSRKRPSYRSSRETLEAEQARLAVAGEAEAEAEEAETVFQEVEVEAEADSPEMAVVGAVSPEIAAEADASLAVAFREAAIEAAAADIPPETAEASNAEMVVVLNAETAAAAVVVLNAETVAAAAVAVDIPPEAETAEKVVIPPPALDPAAVAATGPCNKNDTMVPGT
jgi:hypothetical protein